MIILLQRGHIIHKSSGNVLFLILIAVVLLAALSYAVSRSSRSGPPAITQDKAKLIASDLLEYAAQIDTGVTRMRVINGIPEWQFDVMKGRPDAGAGDLNGSCTSDKCVLYAPDGGNVILRKTFASPAYASVAQYFLFYSSGVKNIGTTLPELITFKGGLTKEICQYINYKSGVSTVLDTTPPGDSHSGSVMYNGTLTSFPASSKIFGSPTNTVFSGKRDFCYSHAAWGYVYIHVVMER